MIKVLTRLAQYSDEAQYSDIRLSRHSNNNPAQRVDNLPVQRSDDLDSGLVLVGIVVPSQRQSLTT